MSNFQFWAIIGMLWVIASESIKHDCAVNAVRAVIYSVGAIACFILAVALP